MGGPQKATTCLSDKGEIEQVKRVRMRKVRVICTDPDATESSSDERDEGEQRGSSQKRVVREILIPALVPSREAAEESCYSASIQDRQFAHTAPPSSSPAPPKRNSNKISSKRRSLKKWRQVSSMSSRARDTLLETGKKACRYKGVRQRRWGKWTAELRESSQGVRMWLGTFDSAKEAAIAYDEAAINLKGSEALTNFGSSSPGSSLSSPDIHLGLSGNHRNDCSPTVDICADNIELPLSCAELKAMEDCLLACSPSSVLDQPNSSDCGLLVSSPSSVLESMFTDDCASAPFQAFDAGMACGKRAEECYSSRHASVRHAGDYMGEHQMGLAMPRDQMEHNLKHEPAALEEPFFEVFGNLYDNEGSNFASQDGPACHEFVPFEDLPDDEGASLTSFELDAEALTWINLQP